MDREIYSTQKLSEHIFRISEMNLVSSFLIVGEKSAILIDCGAGVSEIMPEIRKITALPVTLVASHAHVDHIGGAKEFGRMHIHFADLPLVAYSNSYKQRVDFFKKHNVLNEVKEINGGKLIKYKSYLFTFPFRSGKTFRLGGVTVEAIRTPGHSSGSCIFRIQEDKMILVGDNFIPYLLLQYDFGSSLKKWVKGCEKLLEISDGYTLYGSHGRNAVSRDALMWQYKTAKEIVASTKRNDSFYKKKIVTVTHNEHKHLILRYRTDKIL